MEACAYHEVDESVGTCPSCEQPVCAKCLDAGSQGLCGMCAEVAAAQAAKPAPAAASARPAAPARPRSPTSSLEGAGGSPPPRSRTGALEGGRKPPARAKATVAPGMCPEHPEERASVTCEHCNRRVCGDCLNLYGLCGLCAALPTCARHESMVAEERCQSCKTPYCKGCLNGTPHCPACREKVAAQGGGTKGNRAGTGKLDAKAPPASAGTGKLDPTGAKGPAGKTGKLPPSKAGRSTSRLSGGKAAAALAPSKGGPPWAAVGAGALALGLLVWALAGGGKPQLGEAEASAALRDEMVKVQSAAMAYHKRNGEYPNNSQAILAEIEAQGVKVKELPLPLKLVINVPPTEPWSIGYSQSGTGFEVRGVDGLGRPFSVDGRDVILRPNLRAMPRPSDAPNGGGESAPGGASGGEGSGGVSP